MRRWVMLGVAVAKIGATRFPIDQELFLEGPILDPIKTHFDCLRLLLFYSVVGEAFIGRVVDTDRGRRLRVADFSKGGSNWYGFLAVDEGGPDFSFSCRRHNISHDFGHSVDRAIDRWGGFEGMVWLRRTVTEEIVADSTAAVLSFREVGGVAVDVDNHVVSCVADG